MKTLLIFLALAIGYFMISLTLNHPIIMAIVVTAWTVTGLASFMAYSRRRFSFKNWRPVDTASVVVFVLFGPVSILAQRHLPRE